MTTACRGYSTSSMEPSGRMRKKTPSMPGSSTPKLPTWFPRIAAAYREAAAPAHFEAFIEPGVGNVLSDAVWQRTGRWFALHLKGEG